MKRILMVADVVNWAWGIKSRYIKKYLSDEFFIDICYLNKDKKFDLIYDLYFSFSPYLLDRIKETRLRKVTGLTGGTCYRSFFRGRDLRNKFMALHANNKIFFELVKEHHNVVYYIPNGVDTTLFKPINKTVKNSKFRIGYVGKIRKSKGFEEYIKPATDLCKGTLLVTNTSYSGNALPHKEMPNFYKNIDVYMVASDEEGTPNPALEAAACGKPIISTPVGNMPEFIEDGINGFLIDRHIKNFVEKIKILQNDPELLKKMGKSSRKRAESWDWKIQSENYRKMFRELLK